MENIVRKVICAHVYTSGQGRTSEQCIFAFNMTFVWPLFPYVVENSQFKSIRGTVTAISTDFGWINESIFFNTDVVCGHVSVNVGANVIALVEEVEGTHALKAIKVSVSLQTVLSYWDFDPFCWNKTNSNVDIGSNLTSHSCELRKIENLNDRIKISSSSTYHTFEISYIFPF